MNKAPEVDLLARVIGMLWDSHIKPEMEHLAANEAHQAVHRLLAGEGDVQRQVEQHIAAVVAKRIAVAVQVKFVESGLG